VLLIALAGAVVAMKWIRPGDRRPALVAVPPLAPVTRGSKVIVPAAIELTAMRDALEKAAPPELSGKADIPPLPFVGNFDFGWLVARGLFGVAGTPEGLADIDGAQRNIPRQRSVEQHCGRFAASAG